MTVVRQLCDILQSAREGQVPSHEECYHALRALSDLDEAERRDLMALPDHPSVVGRIKVILERRFRALSTDPESWLSSGQRSPAVRH